MKKRGRRAWAPRTRAGSWARRSRSALATLVLAVALGSLFMPAANAALPGANGKIAFHSNRSGFFEIWTMNGDGTSPTRLTNDRHEDLDPAWSPDGSRIAFEGLDGASVFQIFTMNADGSARAQITSGTTSSRFPSWSPDGARIVFQRGNGSPTDVAPDEDIWTMGADGSNPMNLTHDTTYDETPAWSPDGTRIAFSTLRSGNFEIYTMNVDGTGQADLTNSGAADDRYPNWSPDGRRIVYQTELGSGPLAISSMNSDGTGTALIAGDATHNYQFPDFSPDGLKIIYDGGPYPFPGFDADQEIYAVATAGGTPIDLTANASFDERPAWQPLRATPPDTTPPVIAATVAGTAGTNGWYTSDISVTWSVTDPESSVSTQTGCIPTTVTVDTPGTTLACTATSGGGTSSRSVVVKRDANAPTVTYSGGRPTYSLLQNVTITCTAADATSGLAASTCASINAAAWTFGPGSHTLTANAVDNAGNSKTGTATFSVTVDAPSLCQLTKNLVQGSTKYQSAKPAARTIVDALVNADCVVLTQAASATTPAQKNALTAVYKQSVNLLTADGWLTATQSTALKGLSGAL